ncbi:multidrug ABC transporter substrate-binding protein [Arthrobacter livingstonensis]|uniref:Multidrug ABC transporter substrate-binding protein n=1 Tax=Arthrobacter livingstonensis TaxID=670078 RepID=A0A2V5LMP7_9MICC|nr:FtsX-like permease family protein [Arthrobacter livingstonensis]PYI68950.1 multidrug ABC transporter substrate-binding protein [Arthrobacter livingstonensis]
MGVVSRSVGNAFRNKVRSGAVVVILAVAIGLALAMLVANQAVGAKVDSLKASVGNNLTVNPAGSRGGLGGGNPLTTADATKAATVAHLVSVNGTLSVRLSNAAATSGSTGTGTGSSSGDRGGPGGGFGSSGTTSLKSAVDPGVLGQRNNSNGSSSDATGGTTGSTTTRPAFTIPIQATGVSTSTTATGTAINVTGGAQLTDFAASSTQALVGSTLATKNSLKVGSTFTIQDRTMKVTGIFDAGDAFDNNGIYLPLAATQTLTSQAGQLSSLNVVVDTIENVSATQASLTTALGADKVDVTAGSTNLESAITSLGSVQSISLIAFIASLVTAGLIVLLIMIMVVRERRREIGVLKAIGASNRTIGVQFVLEAMVLVVLGTVVGGVVAAFSSNPIVSALVAGNTASTSSAAGPVRGAGGGFGGGGGGGGFTRTRGAFAGADQLIGTISTSIGWQTLVLGVVGILVIAAIGALIPALLTAKVRPIEVLRGE